MAKQDTGKHGLYVCPGTAVARPCLEVSNRTVFTAHAFLTVLLLNVAVLQSYNKVMAFYSNQPADGEPRWDVFCLICGGPSCNPTKIAKTTYPQHKQVSVISDLPHLSELASNFGWLEDCVGIPEDNMPVALGLYDGQGDFEISGNRLFGPYPSYAQAERTPNKTYGLNCHRKCYHLLHDELGYKLRYQDIWPKLAAANDDSECLDSACGGMAEYHEHVRPFCRQKIARMHLVISCCCIAMLSCNTSPEGQLPIAQSVVLILHLLLLHVRVDCNSY